MPKKITILPEDEAGMSAGEKRRADLLDIAQKIFLEKGFETATINDILAAAALSKGGFYHHFKSKDDVLNALRVRYTQQFLETVERRVALLPDTALEERFQTWIAAYVDAYFSSHAVHDLVYHSVHASRADADRLAVTMSLERLLQQGMDSEVWRLSSAAFTATIIYSAIHGVVDEIIAGGADEMDHLAERLHASLRLLLQA
ncbi:TetR/AcrR family transcriptional regulator [Desulfovibrio sp.]|uniref:TetR/AcrR family transcriptional regulator n=1 Tax=Desulfovibrio sp. TaxID=885 RepID=UPI0025BFBE3D|nr:TetR/AcrR family transcriptional regulator [Desulfovibrio sp.]